MKFSFSNSLILDSIGSSFFSDDFLLNFICWLLTILILSILKSFDCNLDCESANIVGVYSSGMSDNGFTEYVISSSCNYTIYECVKNGTRGEETSICVLGVVSVSRIAVLGVSLGGEKVYGILISSSLLICSGDCSSSQFS